MKNHNIQTTNYKQYTINKNTNKPYNLEQRTFNFSKSIVKLCKNLQNTIITDVLIKQLIRSGTSIGANYIEANEALGIKDFAHRMRITRREAKETSYWLELINQSDFVISSEIEPLLDECRELRNIFTSIINKSC